MQRHWPFIREKTSRHLEEACLAAPDRMRCARDYVSRCETGVEALLKSGSGWHSPSFIQAPRMACWACGHEKRYVGTSVSIICLPQGVQTEPRLRYSVYNKEAYPAKSESALPYSSCLFSGSLGVVTSCPKSCQV